MSDARRVGERPTYEHVTDKPRGMRWHVTSETAANAVTVAYGGPMRETCTWTDGAPYKRVLNVETGRVTYFRRVGVASSAGDASYRALRAADERKRQR